MLWGGLIPFSLIFAHMQTPAPITLNVVVPNVSNTSYQVTVSDGVLLQTLLELVYNQEYTPGSTDPFSFALQFFGTASTPPPSGGYFLGYEVVMINGTGAIGAQNVYWQILVNGTGALHGIDTQMAYAGDTIEFEYTSYSAERHGDTGYNALRAQARTATGA